MRIQTRYGEIELINVTRSDWEFRIKKIGKLPLNGYATNRKDIESMSRSLLRELYYELKDSQDDLLTIAN